MCMVFEKEKSSSGSRDEKTSFFFKSAAEAILVSCTRLFLSRQNQNTRETSKQSSVVSEM